MVFGVLGWRAVSLGLFVEGRSDRAAIPILVKNLGYQSRIKAQIVNRSEMLLYDKMERNVRNMLRERSDIDLIVICIDSERVNPNVTERQVQPVQRRLNQTSPVLVRFAVVDHALEGWLACDEDALRTVLGGSRARINIRRNPEDHPTPADLLKRIFRDNGRVFKKTQHDHEIAERCNPERIAARSPTFRRFAEIIGRPISR